MNDHSTTYSTYRKLRFPTAAIAAVTSALLIFGPLQREAKADHPIAVALIGAGGVVIGGALGGAGMVVAAVITTYGGRGDGGGEGDDGGDDGTMVPGTDAHGNIMEQESRQENTDGTTNVLKHGHVDVRASFGGSASQSVGESDLDSLVQAYVDRSIGARVSTPEDSNSMGAKVRYHHDGDVLKSPSDVSRFVTADKIVSKFKMEGPGYLPFMFEELRLKTHDEPGSYGYSAMVMTAHQNGKQIMEWSASVSQGSSPVYDPLPGGEESISTSKGHLYIRDLLFKIPVTYASDNTAEVTVIVYFEESGKRT